VGLICKEFDLGQWREMRSLKGHEQRSLDRRFDPHAKFNFFFMTLSL
jgi:hypothetical protein